MADTVSSGLLKLAILAGLVAVLGYLGLEENGWISHKPDSTATPQAVTAPTSYAGNNASTEMTQERLHECIEVASDTRLSPSKAEILSSPTGDLRPMWIVSGRVRNYCREDISDLTFRIEIFGKKTDERLDTAEMVLKGITSGLSTRGFVQNVQLRIASPDWSWDMMPIRARPVGGK